MGSNVSPTAPPDGPLPCCPAPQHGRLGRGMSEPLLWSQRHPPALLPAPSRCAWVPVVCPAPGCTGSCPCSSNCCLAAPLRAFGCSKLRPVLAPGMLSLLVGAEPGGDMPAHGEAGDPASPHPRACCASGQSCVEQPSDIWRHQQVAQGWQLSADWDATRGPPEHGAVGPWLSHLGHGDGGSVRASAVVALPPTHPHGLPKL